MREPVCPAHPVESGVAPLPFFHRQSAGCGPFLDAGEIVVTAVTVRPHRQIERCVSPAFVLKSADQCFELCSGLGGGLIWRLWRFTFDLQFKWLLFSRRIVA